MNKLSLTPDQEGYAVEWQATTVASRLEGGASRIRRDFLHAPIRVSVQWTCTGDEVEYLQTFYRVVNEGADPFYMDLIVASPELETYVCRFVPGSFKVTGVTGRNVFKARATIDAEANPTDDAFDEGLVTSFEGFGQEASTAYALLANVVNVLMPANIR